MGTGRLENLRPNGGAGLKEKASPRRDHESGLTIREEQIVAMYDGVMPYTRIAEILDMSSSAVSQILARPHVRDAIRARVVSDALAPLIATREELQVYWTSILRDELESQKDRLKASEYLGKSFAMFLDRVDVKNNITFEDMLAALDGKTRKRSMEDELDDL